MPPKKKQVAIGEGGSKRRFKSESSSSDSEVPSENNGILAMDITQPRTTRQSARTCMRRNRDDSLLEQEMKARGEPKPRIINFDYKALLTNPAYDNPGLYKTMKPENFNMDYYHESGLNEVLKFNCPPEELGMKMVDDQFSVNDVEKLVGGNRIITVVVVATQQSEDMPLKKFVKYFNDINDRPTPDSPKDEKKTLYNVLSLEFSNSGLTDLVQSPSLVRKIDWASSWPDERKMRMITFENDGTFRVQNLYPRVENYCLMSPTECYTDFHVDFHGTSVWYHVKKGKKVFWIIEPTEQNLKMYEEYLKNTETSAFFGDIVEKCARVEVLPGNTLIIPSGWIHAVYTPVDSLVFGGNFLHSRSALMQLNVLQGENRIGINKKYRYPYSEEAVFFYLNRVVKAVTGRDYIRPMTRNQQMKYAEYVGDLFREKGMHLKVPSKEDYEDEGSVWKQEWDESPEYIESKAKLAKWDDKKEEEDENEEDNGKMEVTSDYDDMPVLSPKKEERDEKETTKEKGDGEPVFGGHDDLFVDDYTFYHPITFNLDAGRGATAVHTLPLSAVEPKMRIDPVALKKELHPMEVPQWEGLIVTYLKKSKVDLPEGLTRPNSLIQAFCRLLRERRRMAKEEEGITLPLSVLPSSEGSRRLHEEQKRAAAERKRKYEEKKMKIEEGDGEEDTDWTEETEQPRKKKTRKSTDEVGKMVPSDAMRTKVKKENEEEKERKKHSNTNAWNIAFYCWYADPAQKVLRTQYREQAGKSAREVMRKEIYTKLSKEEKATWIEKAKTKIGESEKRNCLSPVSTTPSESTPLTPPNLPPPLPPPLPLPTPINRPKRSKSGKMIPFDPSPSTLDQFPVDMDDDTSPSSSFSRPTPSSSGKRIVKRGRQKKIEPSDLLDSNDIVPSQAVIKPQCDNLCAKELKSLVPPPPPPMPKPSVMRGLIDTLAAQVVTHFASQPSTSQAEFMRRQNWNQTNLQKEIRNSMPSSKQMGEVRVVTADQSALFQAMHQKLGSEGRLVGSQSVSPADRTKITDEISLNIVNYLPAKDGEFPKLVDFLSKFNFSDEKMNMDVDARLIETKEKLNRVFHKDLTIDQIKEHLQMLKMCAIQGAHLKGPHIPFLESFKTVAQALHIPTPQNGVGGLSSPNVISVKPVDASLMTAQTSKTTSSISTKKMDISGVIGLKPVVQIVVKEDEKKKQEEMEKEKEKEKEQYKEDNENGGKEQLEMQSDFRAAIAEPKPPEEEEEKKKEEMIGREESSFERSSIFSQSIHESICPMTNMLRNDTRREESSKNGKEETVVTENDDETTGIESETETKMDTAPPTTPVKVATPLKEVKKEEEEEDDTDDEFGSNEEWSSGGSVRRSMRESHWMVMKKAQENIPVKRYTDNPQDWTPFDAFLRRNYFKLSQLYNEEPSNSFALKIKRLHWDAIAGEGGEIRRWEEDAMRFRAEGRRRVYWNSASVVEQEDRVVVDRGLKVIPLGGEEKNDQERILLESESGLVIKNEDEYLADDEEPLIAVHEEKDDEMIDVEGMEDEIAMNATGVTETEEMLVEEVSGEVEEPPKKKGKGGRPKKEPVMEKKKKEKRGENEDFMHTGSTPRGKGKKAKPDPNKPLIVDGVPVNPLAEPAVANAYGYDPAKDIVPLGQGQLKSAYRRSKAQLDTPQMDAKRYKLEVKHDHPRPSLDDDDHDDTHRDETEGMEGGFPHPTMSHGGDMMEGINVHTGGDGPSHAVTPSPGPSEQPSPFHLHQRSTSFSRRPMQSTPQTPPLIPHAPSPLAARRISAATDGWAGVSGGRRRSDGERRDRTPGGRSPPRKPSSAHFSPADLPPPSHPLTPTTPSTPAPSTTLSSSKQSRLSQAEQFTMAAPKVIDAPRLATPLLPTQSSNSDLSVVSGSSSMSGEDPLPTDVWCAQMERFTAEIERANAIMGCTSTNGN